MSLKKGKVIFVKIVDEFLVLLPNPLLLIQNRILKFAVSTYTA